MTLDATAVDQCLFISILCHPDKILTPSLCSYAGVVVSDKRRLFGVLTKVIQVDTTPMKLILKDTTTHPDEHPTRESYAYGSSAAIFAFSKSHLRYLASIKESYNEFKQCHIHHPVLPIISLIGLHSDPEIVTTLEGQAAAQELGVAYYEMAVDDLQTLDVILRSLSHQVLEIRRKNIFKGDLIGN